MTTTEPLTDHTNCPTCFPTVSHVEHALNELAALTDIGLIAKYLQAQGYTGACGSAQECVLAEYLMAYAHLDGYDTVNVGPCGVIIWSNDGQDMPGPTFPLPEPLKVFIAAFDMHEYPELVRW